MPNKNVKLNLNKQIIKDAFQIGTVMKMNGALYEKHPINKLLKHIVEEINKLPILIKEKK